MSSLTAILDAMGEALNDVMGPGVLGEEAVQVVSRMNLDPQAPTSIDIYPADPFRDIESAGFGDREGELIFTVRARVTTSDTDAAQDKLLALLDDESPFSVAAALEADPTLDGIVSQLHVDGDTGYRVFDDPPGAMLGVAWRARVLNLPSEVERVSRQNVLVKTTNLTSAELLDLHNTPVELLPAPGGRFYYIVSEYVLHYRFVTTPYDYVSADFKTALGVFWGNDPDQNNGMGYFQPLTAGGVPSTQDILKATEDNYVFDTVSGGSNLISYRWTADQIEDQPISIGLDPNRPTQLLNGDSTLTVRLFYSLIDGAPS